MQKKKARKGFLFLRENLCCRLVGRGPCAPPGAMRISRRDTWVPPYKVRRSYGADRVVRLYEGTDSHASDTVTGSE